MSLTIEMLVCKQKCTSSVWGYFGFVPKSDDSNQPKDPNEAICKICFKETGSLPKPVRIADSNTSNLLSHLRVHHTEVHSQLKAAMEKAKQHSSTSLVNEVPSKQQPKMDAFVKNNLYSRGSTKWKSLTNSMTHCIAKDMLPIRIVEKEGFKALVKNLDPRYELPSRKYMSKKAIPDLYSKTRASVESQISTTEYFAATTDIWSSNTMEPYLSYTLHYVSQDWQIKTYYLETLYLPQDHTGINIADALETILESWNLKSEQQVCITTDNGSNMVAAIDRLGWDHLSCFGHNLNLAVTNALKDETRVTRAIAVCKKVVQHFAHSWKKRRSLTEAQITKGLPQHALVTDCPTRWGSQHKMIFRILEQDAAIRMVLSEDRKTTHLIPTWQDSMVLESVNAALSPVAEFTDFMSGEKYVSISAIKPLMRHLERVLLEEKEDESDLTNLERILLEEKEDESDLTKNIKQQIFEYMDSKYNDTSTDDLLNLCTFLDPRFKFDYIKKDKLYDSTVALIKGIVQREVVALIKKESQETEAREEHDDLQNEVAQPSEPSQPPRKKKRLAEIFKKPSSSHKLRAEDIAAGEIDQYIHSPCAEVDSNPLEWWKTHYVDYSHLACLAKKYLCIPATSVASECLFSTSGNIVTDKRCCLKPERVNMLTFLAKNL